MESQREFWTSFPFSEGLRKSNINKIGSGKKEERFSLPYFHCYIIFKKIKACFLCVGVSSYNAIVTEKWWNKYENLFLLRNIVVHIWLLSFSGNQLTFSWIILKNGWTYGVKTTRFLKYAWTFFNIMHEKVNVYYYN